MLLEGGQVLAGRYRLVKLLGEGGMGAVWEAIHMITLKPVALKHLKTSAGDATIVQRFFREARAASAVRHPNVVKIHDVLELDGGLFMVMDLLEGESLEALLEREQKLSVARTSKLLGDVVAAVRAAHAVGIVHRDLKPANIFLVRETGEECVRVLDFGIAKVLERTGDAEAKPLDGKLTATGAVLGTPYYMAPEQVWGEAVDTRADVWALGVVLYECLAGRRPIEGENMGQLLKAIATQAIEPLGKVDPTLPASLVEVVMKMLRGDRNERLADLEVLATELAKYTDGDASPRVMIAQVATVTSVDPLGVTGREEEPRHEDPPSKVVTASALSAETRPPERAKSRWSVLVAGIALVAAASGVYVWRTTGGLPAVAASTSLASPSTPSATAPAPSVTPASPETSTASATISATVATSGAAPARSTPSIPRRGTVPSASSSAARPTAASSTTTPASATPSAGVGGLHVPAPF